MVEERRRRAALPMLGLNAGEETGEEAAALDGIGYVESANADGSEEPVEPVLRR
jgi:hypothetical protein